VKAIGVGAARRESGRLWLETQTQLEKFNDDFSVGGSHAEPSQDIRIKEVPVGNGTHLGAAPGAGADKPFRGQHLDGFSNRCAADAKLRRHRALVRQNGAFAEPASNYLVSKLVDETVRDVPRG
jgi:hypothetical protein